MDFSSRREQTADKPAANTAADDDDEHDVDADEHAADDDEHDEHGDEHDSELVQGWLGFSGAWRSTIEMLTNTLCQRSTIDRIAVEKVGGVRWKGLTD